MANGHKILITEAEVMAEEDEQFARAEKAEARIKELEAEYDELAMKSYRIPQKHHWRGECGHEWRIDQAGECPICERYRLAADCAALREALKTQHDRAMVLWEDWLEAARQYSVEGELYSDKMACRASNRFMELAEMARQALSTDHPGDKLLVAIKAAGVLHNLVDELCAAVDAEGEDVGGHRGSLTILKEIGPADDELGQALDRLGDA